MFGCTTADGFVYQKGYKVTRKPTRLGKVEKEMRSIEGPFDVGSVIASGADLLSRVGYDPENKEVISGMYFYANMIERRMSLKQIVERVNNKHQVAELEGTYETYTGSPDSKEVSESSKRRLVEIAKLSEHVGGVSGLPRLKIPLHSCSLAGSTSAMKVSIPIAFVLPGKEHECNESFKLGRPPALS
ncbi:hypothetical protein Tco_0291285 [Tanacetum coccineum]